MLPLRYQIPGHFLVGLLIGCLLSLAFPATPSEIERKAQPFTTQEGMLLVRIRVHRNAPPEILAVQPLAEGRATATTEGDYALSLLDARGRILLTRAFTVTFVLPGEPPRATDTVETLLIVPVTPEVTMLRLSAPQGAAEYQLAPTE